MKNDSKVLTTIVIILIFAVSILTAVTSVSQTGNISVVNNAIPDSINLILKNSCTPCHSGGNIIASSHLNISKWTDYSAKEQVLKGKAVCEIITSGDMPPKSVKKSNPEKIPTEKQLAMICKWSNSLSAE